MTTLFASFSSTAVFIVQVGCTSLCAASVQAPVTPLTTPSCPASLATAQSADAVPGWEVVRKVSRGRLAAFAFYDEPPKDGYELAPSGEQRRGARDVSTWTFESPRGRPHLVCQYRDTDVVLVRPLPANVLQCSVAVGRVNANLTPQSLSCR